MGDKWHRVRAEFAGYGLRLEIIQRFLRLLSPGGLGVLRAAVYRGAGLKVGKHTVINGAISFGATASARAHFRVGAGCYLNSHIFVDTTAPVLIADGVSIGHHVVIITTNHAIGPSAFRAGAVQALPVTVESGAWIAAGVTLLPGVTIGRGAVVAAGAVVSRNVPPNTLVGGIPAKLIRHLET